jgi:hypothetical protein
MGSAPLSIGGVEVALGERAAFAFYVDEDLKLLLLKGDCAPSFTIVDDGRRRPDHGGAPQVNGDAISRVASKQKSHCASIEF